MYKWFNGVTTIEELRKKYRELLKQYHPDNDGGSVETTQEINSEYDRIFAVLSRENNSDGESTTYDDKAEDKAENDAFKEILNQIIGYDIEIEIIGKWIWCFNCYAYRNKLKELNFKYAPRKKSWTWHYGDYRKYHKGETDLNDIRAKYGSQKVSRRLRQFALD
jgi:DnaJ-class molecular chaperone with C-terminal Zn finger domain